MLDNRTLFIISILLSACFSLAMFQMWRAHGNSTRGIGYWSAAYAVNALASVLFALRHQIHDLFSIVAANTLAALAGALLFDGISRFASRRANRAVNYMVVSAVFVSFAYFGLVEANYRVRTMIIFSALTLLFVHCAWLLYNCGKSDQPGAYRLNAFIFMVSGAIYFAQAIISTRTLPTEELMSSNAVNLGVTTFSLSGTVIAIGLMLMVYARIAGMRKRSEDELMKQQRELAVSEGRYRSVIASSPIGISAYDASGRCVAANEAMGTIVGGSAGQLHAQSFHEIQSWKAAGIYDKALSALRTGDMQGHAVDVTGASGEKFHLNCYMVPIEDGGLLFMAHDMTEITKASQSHRAILETSIDGYWLVDMTGRFLEVNEAYCTLSGYSREELLGGMRIPDVEVVESPQDTARHIEKILSTGGDRFETKHRRKDGAVLEIEVSANYMPLDGGRIFVFLRDITGRKRGEAELALHRERLEEIVSTRTQELAESEEKFRTIFERSTDGLVVFDFESRTISFHNQAFRRMLRYGAEDDLALLGVGDLHPKDALPDVMAGMEQGLKGEIDVLRDAPVIRKDGSVFYADITGALFDYGGRESLLGVFRDVTERTQYEARLVALTDELRRKNETLAGALQDARAAAKVKDQFIANLSHELRTPLNGIIGLADLLVESRVDDDQRDQLGMISASADALLVIINDLLDYSKIAAGKFSLRNEAFALRQVFGETMNFFVVRAQEKGISLLFDVHVDVPDSLVGDQFRLKQVLVNLIGNAIKFTSEGVICVKVTLVGTAPEIAGLRFSVKDTGIGISQEQMENIFKPFTQADGSLSRSYGGTGLGLAISSEIVQAMGGRLEAQSDVAAGSEFFFEVPFAVQAQAGTVSAARNRHELPGASGKPIEVLLAEDNLINQKLAIRLLGRMGHSVFLANHGREALEAFEKKHYDIILMDVMMPVMDGLDASRVIRRIEARENRPRTPIIAITAKAMPEDRERCLDAGMDAYLSKPVDYDELRKAITGLTA